MPRCRRASGSPVPLLYKELDAGGGDHRKVRRSVIAEKYDDIIGRSMLASPPSRRHHHPLPGRHDQRIRTTLAVDLTASAPPPRYGRRMITRAAR